MSAAGAPDAIPFDPIDAAPAELRTLLPPAGDDAPLVVAVEAGSPVPWWSRVALAIADAVVTPERPGLLIDLHVPSALADGLGSEPGDGLTDVLFFGASLEHSLQRPDGHAFEFLPAGAGATDAAHLAEAGAWPALLRRLSGGGRTIMIVAPAAIVRGAPWAAPEHTVVLSRSTGSGRTVMACALRLAPAEPPALATAAASSRARRAAPAVAGGARSRRNPLVLTLLVVLAVSVLAGLWHLVLRGWLARGQTVDGEAATPPALAAPDTTAPVAMAWSVALEAHPDLPTAQARVASLEAADSGARYFISPVLVDSSLYYRVMAGPVRDSAAAARVSQRLVDLGQRVASSAREIRRAPLSFLIAEYATRAEAEARRQELRTLDIPAFVLESPARETAPFRVYSGAYSGLAEADVMAAMLRSAGLPDSLVTLTGGSP